MWGSYAIFKEINLAIFIPRHSIEECLDQFEEIREKRNLLFSEEFIEHSYNVESIQIQQISLGDISKIICNYQFLIDLLTSNIYVNIFLTVINISNLTNNVPLFIKEEDIVKSQYQNFNII